MGVRSSAQPRLVGPAIPSAFAERVARWVVLVYSVAAVSSLATWPARRGEFDPSTWWDRLTEIVNLPVVSSLFWSIALVLLAGALVRRKRFALWIVMVFQAIGVLVAVAVIIAQVTHRRPIPARFLPDERLEVVLDLIGGAVGLLALILLWPARTAFPARRSPGSYWAALLVLALGLAASLTVGIATTVAFSARSGGLRESVIYGVHAALGLSLDVSRMHGHHPPGWVPWLAATISAVALLASAWVFLRSHRGHPAQNEATELAVRKRLLAQSNPDSLGYFGTRRDKSIMTSPDGRAVIAYRVIASVSLAAADPIGPEASWPAAIAAWRAEARTYGWVPAVIAAGADAARHYVQAGLRPIALGDEAIIEVPGFDLAQPAMKSVRQAVNRAKRAGYTVRIRRHREIDAAGIDALAQCAEQWRGDAPERGFSMALSRLGDPADGNCLMVDVVDSSSRAVGLLSLVPWGTDGVSLDLMRRSPRATNGVIELMVAALAARGQEFGIRRISLNFAMFRAVFADAEQLGAGPITRLNNAVLTIFNRFFQLESLYRSNAKYHPLWVPRYLCIDSPLSLPRVGIAAGMAEGFLPTLRRNRAQQSFGPEFAAAVEQAETEAAQRQPPTVRVSELARHRLAAMDLLAESGVSPYPVTVPRSDPLPMLLAGPDGYQVSATGRITAVRDHGKLVFADMMEDGAQVQVLLDASAVGKTSLTLWRRAVRRGDLVSVTGALGASRRGTRSVLATTWTMAAKALRSLPPPRSGLLDPQARIRQRSLDLLLYPNDARLLTERSSAVAAVRAHLIQAGYTEVETPILQTVHGGAAARPFVTQSNAYRQRLSLRIAPELFLKRLVVGGMGPIFEIGRNFRNEGVDSTHNPEFTSMEAYLPYGDYTDMRLLATDLIRAAAAAVHGRPVARRVDPASGQSVEIDLSGDWPVVTVHQAVAVACAVPVTPDTPVGELSRIAAERGLATRPGMSASELVLALYEQLVEPNTVRPTFFTDFPLETSPLTRPHRTDPRLAERWDLVAFGMEIGTAYSELVDPVDQRARLTAQSMRAAAGDPDAMQLDEDFLAAIELGMPPTGGLGIGMDRLAMMLTGAPIRGVLTFPFVRPAGRV